MVICPLIGFGQQQWTLDQCIDHAVNNNLSLKTTLLNISQSEITKQQAIKNHLPSLNAAGTHGYNWGQSIDPFTNQFATERVRTNNLYVSSNWILFNGLQNYHLTQKAKTEIAYQKYNQEVQQRNLKIDVTAHYLQVLLNHRKLLNAQEQIAYTKSLLKRTQELVDAEQLAEYALLEIESQLALDSLAITQNSNELRLSKLKLKQFLNIKPEDTFEILLDEIIDSPLSITGSVEINSLPEIKQLEEQEKVNTTNLQIAKGKLSPTLSINASLGSGYSGNNVELIGTEILPKPFNRQLDENFYQSATLTLSIPIFNNGFVNSEIALNKIEIEKTTIQKEQTIMELQNKMEQLNIEIENAAMQKNTSEVALKTTQKSLEIAQLKYEEGIINFTDFLEIRKKHFEAQSQFTNAQFEHLFKMKILGYYSE